MFDSLFFCDVSPPPHFHWPLFLQYSTFPGVWKIPPPRRVEKGWGWWVSLMKITDKGGECTVAIGMKVVPSQVYPLVIHCFCNAYVIYIRVLLINYLHATHTLANTIYQSINVCRECGGDFYQILLTNTPYQSTLQHYYLSINTTTLLTSLLSIKRM